MLTPFDAMERLLNISLSHDGADAVTLSSNTYDAVGRLASHTKGTVLLVCFLCDDFKANPQISTNYFGAKWPVSQ